MNYLLLFSGVLLLTIQEARTKDQRCHGIVIRDYIYERHALEDASRTQLAVDYKTNTLFYSKDSVNKFYNLEERTTGKIEVNNGGTARAVDNNRHVVYLGGKDGLYKYDYNSKAAAKLDFTDDNINQLFIKDFIYYTSQEQEAYVIKDGKKTLIPELQGLTVRVIAVDKDDNIFFSNNEGLYEYKKDLKKVIKKGDYKVNGFDADSKGNLYFSTLDGIYYINEEGNVEQFVLIPDTRAIAIDASDNIIFCSNFMIVKLEKTNKKCSVVKSA